MALVAVTEQAGAEIINQPIPLDSSSSLSSGPSYRGGFCVLTAQEWIRQVTQFRVVIKGAAEVIQ